jgi:hypothetical protein
VRLTCVWLLVYSWLIVVRERAPCNTCSRIDTRHVVEYRACVRTVPSLFGRSEEEHEGKTEIRHTSGTVRDFPVAGR